MKNPAATQGRAGSGCHEQLVLENSSVEFPLFQSLIEVLQKEIGFRVFGGEESVELPSLWAEKDNGGVAFDRILLRIRIVFLSEFLVAVREVKFNENEGFARLINELLFREDVLTHRDARRTPVGAGELDEDGFLLLLRLDEGFLKIGRPAFQLLREGGADHGGCAQCEGGEVGDGFHIHS